MSFRLQGSKIQDAVLDLVLPLGTKPQLGNHAIFENWVISNCFTSGTSRQLVYSLSVNGLTAYMGIFFLSSGPRFCSPYKSLGSVPAWPSTLNSFSIYRHRRRQFSPCQINSQSIDCNCGILAKNPGVEFIGIIVDTFCLTSEC